jgi:hypothetical protein
MRGCTFKPHLDADINRTVTTHRTFCWPDCIQTTCFNGQLPGTGLRCHVGRKSRKESRLYFANGLTAFLIYKRRISRRLRVSKKVSHLSPHKPIRLSSRDRVHSESWQIQLSTPNHYSRLNSGNACYHSVQNLLCSHLLSKNIKIRIYKTIILPVFCMGMKLGL